MGAREPNSMLAEFVRAYFRRSLTAGCIGSPATFYVHVHIIPCIGQSYANYYLVLVPGGADLKAYRVAHIVLNTANTPAHDYSTHGKKESSSRALIVALSYNRIRFNT